MKVEALKEICNAFGPTGREKAVATIVSRRASESGMDIEIDALGNVIALAGPEGPRNVFCTHMDQPGWMAEHVDKEGLLHIKPLPAKNHLGEGWAIDERANLFRVFSQDKGTSLKAEPLNKDTGKMGCYLVPKPEFETSSDYLFSSVLTDRLFSELLLEVAEDIDFDSPVAFIFYTGRYIRASGLLATLDGLDIGRCFVLEALKASENTRVGSEPYMLLRSRQSIAPRSWVKKLTDFSEKIGIKLQKGVCPEHFSAADVLARSGLPSLVLGIAVDNIGSRIEKASKKDFSDLKELIKKLASGD